MKNKEAIKKFIDNEKNLEIIGKNLDLDDVLENPYILTGFVSLEKIEKLIENDKNFQKMDLRDFRTRAYIFEYANIQFKNNHTAFKKSELIEFIQANTNNEVDEVFIGNVIKNLISKDIYIKKVNESILTTHYYYEVEFYIYKTIKENMGHSKGEILNSIDLEEYIDSCEREQGFKYAEKQRDILIKVNKRNNIDVLNGYAGTGKTTTIKGILDLYTKVAKKKIICAAFSGVAASRIKQATGYDAITVHSLLGYDGEKFNRNENNKLDYDLIVLDEGGMLNSTLLAVFFNSICFSKSSIIFAGDLAQLQPVSNGEPFRNIIQNKIVSDVIVLDKVYRQKEEQAINIIAQSVRLGELPDYQRKYADFEFIHSLGDNILEDMKKCIQKVKVTLDVFMNEKRYEEYINFFQIITPIRKSELGVDALNLFAQKMLNNKSMKLETKRLEFDQKSIMEYDKVIHLQNRIMKTISYSDFIKIKDMDLNGAAIIETNERKVMNGQVGIVLKIAEDLRNRVFVYYPLDDYVTIYTNSDVVKFKLLDLGYALTVHKMQGSQNENILIPIVSRFKIMLNAQLLYTAITRAKNMLTVVGEKSAFEYGATNIDKNRRITVLSNISNQ